MHDGFALTPQCPQTRLEHPDRLAHGGLDVKGLDVLPVLFEQGNEEVDALKM